MRRALLRKNASGGGFSFGNALDIPGNPVPGTPVTFTSVATTDDFTLQIWIKPYTFSHFCMISLGTPGYFQFRSSTLFRLRTGVNNDFTISTPMVASNWYHVVLSVISGIARLYVNGVVSASTHNISSYTFNWQTISTSAVNGIDSIVDEYAINDTTGATATNVTDLYNGGSGADFDSIMGSSAVYYHMNESGTDTTAVDSSGNGNDGALSIYFPTSGMWVAH